jgi:hypothetical protein
MIPSILIFLIFGDILNSELDMMSCIFEYRIDSVEILKTMQSLSIENWIEYIIVV